VWEEEEEGGGAEEGEGGLRAVTLLCDGTP
jgi:hypothetical protein